MKTKTEAPPKTLQGEYAGFISRFLAFMIDVLVVVAIVTIVGITFDIITRFFGLQQLIDDLMAREGILAETLRLAALFGSVAVINVGYFILMWNVTGGQSVGKVLIGLRIVPLDGSRMSFLRSTVRYIAFIASAMVLFIGLLWVLISDRRQGWHDKIARTCVIYDWPAREDDGVFGNVKTRWGYLKQARQRFMRRSAGPQLEANVENENEPAAEETRLT